MNDAVCFREKSAVEQCDSSIGLDDDQGSLVEESNSHEDRQDNKEVHHDKRKSGNPRGKYVRFYYMFVAELVCRASVLFGCTYQQTSPFKYVMRKVLCITHSCRNKIDPFNHHNKLEGFQCRKDGVMGGSLYITHGKSKFRKKAKSSSSSSSSVNGAKLSVPELIYGTPKLEYPYDDFETGAFSVVVVVV